MLGCVVLVLCRILLISSRVVSCCTRTVSCRVVLYSYSLVLFRVYSNCVVLSPVVNRVVFWTTSFQRGFEIFKGATKLYVTHYSRVVILLFNTNFLKFALPTYFKNLVFCLSIFCTFVSSIFNSL